MFKLQTNLKQFDQYLGIIIYYYYIIIYNWISSSYLSMQKENGRV